MSNENKKKLTPQDKSDIVYFHQYRGDIERWVGWENAKPLVQKEYPELLDAMERLVSAKRTLSAIVMTLGDAHIED